jgi:hypothetical protein
MLVIGVCGRAEAGKSSASKAIFKEAVSNGLRPEIFEISSYVLKDAIGQNLVGDKDRENLTAEEIAQLVNVGTKRRSENPQHWIELLRQDVADRNPDVALIPNLRFLNEADFVRESGGKIIRVKSYVVDGVEFISPSRNANHISEVEHHQIQADHFITVLRGESLLLAKQAATLFNYLYTKG